MQAETDRGQPSPTLTRSARRAQIVAAAIEVIAEEGSQRTSFARIAERAGLSSTGMISYHFRSKDDLFAACVTEIEHVTGAAMAPRLDAAVGYLDTVRAYVEANVALVDQHPAAVRALIDLITSRSATSPGVDRRVELFIEHLRAGQEAGELRAFDAATVAVALAGAIDAVVAGLVTTAPPPDDIARAGRELAALYTRGLAAHPVDRRTS